MAEPIAKRLAPREKRPAMLLDAHRDEFEMDEKSGNYRKRRPLAPSESRRLKLFNTNAESRKLAPPLGSELQELAGKARGTLLTAPDRPSARSLAYGAEGTQLEMFHDEEGRFYHIGDLVWYLSNEQTDQGVRADAAAEKAAKVATAQATAANASKKDTRKLVSKARRESKKPFGPLRRHGQLYYAVGRVLRIEADGVLNATRQAPRILLQEHVDHVMLTEYRMVQSFRLPMHQRATGIHHAAMGWRIHVPSTAIDGHALVEWRDTEEQSAEGVVIGSALELARGDEDPLVVIGASERKRNEPFICLNDEERALMPQLCPMPRSPYEEAPAFPPIPITHLGFVPGVGIIMSGINATTMNWGHGYAPSDDLTR